MDLPQFQQLRQALQASPQLLPVMLQQLSQENPQLLEVSGRVCEFRLDYVRGKSLFYIVSPSSSLSLSLPSLSPSLPLSLSLPLSFPPSLS